MVCWTGFCRISATALVADNTNIMNASECLISMLICVTCSAKCKAMKASTHTHTRTQNIDFIGWATTTAPAFEQKKRYRMQNIYASRQEYKSRDLRFFASDWHDAHNCCYTQSFNVPHTDLIFLGVDFHRVPFHQQIPL